MIKQESLTQTCRWVHAYSWCVCVCMYASMRVCAHRHTHTHAHNQSLPYSSCIDIDLYVPYTSGDSLEFACFSSQAICVNTSSNLLFIKNFNWNDENRLMSDSLEYKYNLDAEFVFFCQFSPRNRWLFCFSVFWNTITHTCTHIK